MRRRRFLEGCGLGLAGLLTATGASPAAAWSRGRLPREIRADLAILGGGLGGCAAALAALKMGKTVVMTEPTDWIGGQLTSQAVPPDEHPWIETFGANASYMALRRGIRDYYRRSYPLTAEARARIDLNPGNGGVSRLCHEPRVALAVLTEMLAPFASAGKLTVLLEHRPILAPTDGDRVDSVLVVDKAADDRWLHAPYFLDATELGDMLPLANMDFVTGFEAREDVQGDPRHPERGQPANHQAITCCFAMDYLAGQDHTLDKPDDYAFWREYVPKLNPAWPGPLFGPSTDPVTLKTRPWLFDPTGPGEGFWVYRRIADARNFAPGTYPGGITLVNWPQNDYLLGNLIGVTPEAADRHLSRARTLSLSLLYWLQTEAPRPDGGTGWKGLRLRPDLVGTKDGLAKAPYIRESRRIRAEFTVLESHVGTEARRKALNRQDVEAERFPDRVGVGSYRIDLHPSTGGDNYIDVSSLPFTIPLGALIPRLIENLLPACKNLGVTHVTNGCYRLHPVEWAIGEAAGSLAAHSLDTGESPRAIRNTPKRLAEFQKRLVGQGVEIDWPKLTPR